MVAEPPQWTVFPIPAFPSDVHITLYKHIRLTGLRLDPEAFGSTFERESTFTDETWRSRINTRGRTTLIAITGDVEDIQAIGTLSVLGPDMLAGIPQDPTYPPPISEKERDGLVDVHVLVGMWVDTNHRSKGIGRALVERALEVIKASPSRSSTLESGIRKGHMTEHKGKTALLLVHNDQHTARNLYKAAGFTENGQVEHAGRASTWMSYTIALADENVPEKS